MKRLALAPLLLLWHPTPARAGSCHGSDSGSDGGSSSSGSSSSSDSTSSSDSSDYSTYSSSTPVGCVETSDVLGRRQCSGFADWAMPRLSPPVAIEVGTTVRTLALSQMRFSGTVDHGDMGSYRVSMSGRPQDRADAAAITSDLRALSGRRLYFGAELAIGGISADESALDMSVSTGGTDATADPRFRLYLATGAVAGLRANVSRFTLAAEAFGGMRMIDAEVTSRYGTCETTATARNYAATVELRARADLWLTPWLTLGLFTGQDALHPTTRALGLTLGGHIRAFDALR